MNWYLTSPAVGCLNNDRTVMSLPYAWRILAFLSILKGSACTNTSKDWQAQRRMALYHSAMAHIIPELNDICAKDDYYRFADKLVRQGLQPGPLILASLAMWRLEQRAAAFYQRQRHSHGRTGEGAADGQWNLVLYNMLYNMLNYVCNICIYNMLYNTLRLYSKSRSI